MAILLKQYTDSMQSPIKISKLERANLKFNWNNKKPRIAKTILNSKRSSKGISILDIKQYYNSVKNCIVLV